MKWATAFIGSTAVARFAGSDIFCFVTWGYARKASLHPRLYADARFAGSMLTPASQAMTKAKHAFCGDQAEGFK